MYHVHLAWHLLTLTSFVIHFFTDSLAVGTRHRSSKFCDFDFVLKALKRKEASPIRFGMKIQVKNILKIPIFTDIGMSI